MGKNMSAGLLAGDILAVVLGIYLLIRGQGLVTSFKELDETFGRMSDRTLYFLLMWMFVLIALVFGS